MSDTENNSDTEDDEDLDNPDYKNWVRAAKGLEYLQQGLAPFVSTEITENVTTFFERLRLASGQVNCNQCNKANLFADHPGGICISRYKNKCYCNIQINNRRLCPNGVCSKLYHFIVQEHRSNDPLWRNSDIAKWCSDVWFVAKCFMTCCSTGNSAQSTDAAGLLSIVVNAKFFQPRLTCRIDPGKDDFSKARNARNEILHKAEIKLSEQELFHYIDLFVAVLHDPKTLLKDKNAQDAVKKLLKLKDNQIHISMGEKKKILLDTEEALIALKTIGEEKAIGNISTTKDVSIQCIKDKKVEVLDDLEKVKADVISGSEIEQKIIKTVEDVAVIDERLKHVEEYLENINNQEIDRCISRSHSKDESQDTGAASEHYYGSTKIKTDEDTIVNVEDTDVSLRDYHKELAQEGLKGANVVIMAPTNSGKTRVACKITQEHLRRKRDGKVIFLVENETLAYQQGKVFSKLLPAYRTKVISGTVQRDKKMFLKDFIHIRDILVVTAQILLNSLKTKEIDSLEKFSLIVFDECHHAKGFHRYNEIMGHYIDMKFQNVSPLPQVVGLTASLGIGGNSDHKAAMDHMEKLLTNLDAAFLCTVRQNKEELQKIENKAKEHIVVTEGRVDDLYKKAILENMHAIDDYMINHQSLSEVPPASELKNKCRVPSTAGDASFQNWLSDFKKALCDVDSKRVRRMMFPCFEHLEIYNKSLMVHADARIKDARAVLVEFMEKQYKADETCENETDKMLLELYECLKAKSFDNEPENPKLLKLGELIINILGNDKRAKGIVFVESRDLAKAISNWMNETDNLKQFYAKKCVGQAVSVDKGGMTRAKQRNVLEYFRGGRHKLIIATSIVEEGIDITMCNLVIRYEHVTNEIVRLQSRGRARAANSKYYVLTEARSWIVGKEQKIEMLEDLINQIVPQLQAKIESDPLAWQQRLTERQKYMKQLEEERNERDRRAKMAQGVKELKCLKCLKFICLSSDIRRIKDTQHVVIDEDVQKRITWTRKPIPKFKNDDLKFDGTTLCGNSTCKQKLGGVCEYMGIEFPLIAISYFRVVDENNKGRTFKKWKDVNFDIEDYSLEQFQEIVDERK
ncbi:antiviral innate immune response receptor RIG-I-like [Ruditapes philippinarum]|uniref:antiviral innate immune response receptor RIG-I-like n=1 Tax=Ruditapes philippinarum TaxID=129788 RepID=UPI00295ABDBB|nr:antiviral innate immune response receptor RIG-I-like [Ruditapes philippinarum]XP_060586934.1 antiviral innate immune response receptor RIG-I-like [Ruditapes philippinarum]